MQTILEPKPKTRAKAKNLKEKYMVAHAVGVVTAWADVLKTLDVEGKDAEMVKLAGEELRDTMKGLWGWWTSHPLNPSFSPVANDASGVAG